MTSHGPRVWLITGTSSGFGLRLVSIVLARGDRVIATARTLASIAHFQSDPELPRSNIHCAELDITIGTEQVKKRVDMIIQESGWRSVDVLVNNAGKGIVGFLEEGGTETMRDQYETNVFGTFDVTMAILPYMRQQKSGTVAMVGSRSGWRPDVKGLGFYGSSKAAVHAFAETMSVELEPFGIRMLIVEPGSFRTEGINRHGFGGPKPIPEYDGEREPIKRLWKARTEKQPGDPVKAMRALVEVVCGEGRAQGKAWPLYLVLGKDAERDVRNKCTQMIRYLDEWGDIARDVDFDDLEEVSKL